MSLETPARRAPNTSLVMLLVGLVGGATSTLFFSGYLPGFEQQAAVPEANLASGEPGAQNTQGPRGIDQDTGLPYAHIFFRSRNWVLKFVACHIDSISCLAILRR